MLNKRMTGEDRPLLQQMKDCVRSLSELLTDLLDLSKLDAGVVTPNVSDFAIADMMANLVSVHGPEAQLKNLGLRCAASDLVARTDAVLFRRMLGNLLSNALRYTERGGVLIGCRRHAGKVWVEVWDSGIGFPADKTGEIFEEFKQLGDDRRSSRGSGLGFAIVAKSAALLAPELVVSDYRLAKGETGFEVIASVRAVFGAAVPAVLVTGDTDPELTRRMAARDIVVRHKPLEIDASQNWIAEVMERHRTHAHRRALLHKALEPRHAHLARHRLGIVE